MKKKLSVILCGFIIKDIDENEEKEIEISFPKGITKECIKKQIDKKNVIVKYDSNIICTLDARITLNNTIKIYYNFSKENCDYLQEIQEKQNQIVYDIKRSRQYIKALKRDIESSLYLHQENNMEINNEEYYHFDEENLPYYEDLMELIYEKNRLKIKIKQYIDNYETYHIGEQKIYQKMKHRFEKIKENNFISLKN